MSNPDHDLGRPTIIEIKDSLVDPYRITQAVRGLGPDRRIVTFGAIAEGTVMFVSEPKEPRHNLATSQPVQSSEYPPFTRPYAPWDSWNPSE